MRNNQFFRSLIAKASEGPKPLTDAEKHKQRQAVKDADRKKTERIKKKLERTKRWKDRQQKLNDAKEEREAEASKYRDRAKEVEKGQNPDYEEDDQINFAEMDYETSKYLGGDVQHTHMVKGLDYILLNRKRQEMSVKEDEQLEAEYQKATKAKKKTEKTAEKEILFKNRIARGVHRILFKKEFDEEDKHLRGCQKFLPGRMVFEFDVFTDNSRYVPTPVHVSNFDAVQGPNTLKHGVSAPLMYKMKECFGHRSKGRRRKKKKKRRREQSKYTVKEEIAKKRVPMAQSKLPEDDIYSDDGQEYNPSKTNEPEKKKKYFFDPTDRGATRTKVEAANILGKVMAKANKQTREQRDEEGKLAATEALIAKRKTALKKQNAVALHPKKEPAIKSSYYSNRYYDSSGDEGMDSDDDPKPKKKKAKFQVSRRSKAKAEDSKLKREAMNIVSSYQERNR